MSLLRESHPSIISHVSVCNGSVIMVEDVNPFFTTLSYSLDVNLFFTTYLIVMVYCIRPII